jgi:hypothetical protein
MKATGVSVVTVRRGRRAAGVHVPGGRRGGHHGMGPGEATRRVSRTFDFLLVTWTMRATTRAVIV